MDQNLITLTHVCGRWRDIFIADSPLWTHLDCTSVEKTSVFIERSKSSPLKVSLGRRDKVSQFKTEAFRLVIPHISRINSLRIIGGQSFSPYLARHLFVPLPLLRDLKIDLDSDSAITLDDKLFNGDPSSLRTLSLSGVVPPSPWWNLSKLNTFVLRSFPGSEISITQLLDFFANSPLLGKVELRYLPDSSNAPPGRVLSLPRLESLTIVTDQTSPSALLNHLSIPTGASLHLEFDSAVEDSLRKFLPKTSKHLHNVFFITSVYLYFKVSGVHIQLTGPSGELYVFSKRRSGWSESQRVSSDHRILQSLDYFDTLSKAQTLAVTTYGDPYLEEEYMDLPPPHSILHIMKDLRTLFINRLGQPFILDLNPDQNPSKLALCPKLENLILCVQDGFDIGELMKMAKKRASEGVKLRSITVIDVEKAVSERKVLKLKKYVTHVEYKVGKRDPDWNRIPGHGSS